MATEAFQDKKDRIAHDSQQQQDEGQVLSHATISTKDPSSTVGPAATPSSSFVPDLMKVYENIIGGNSASQSAYSNAKQWSFENTTSAPIPPIPGNLSEAMKFAAATIVPPGISMSHAGLPGTSKPSSVRSSNGRNLRKRSSSITSAPEEESSTSSTRTSKSRRKQKSTDGRWSKRFTWPEHLHRDFVAAIFDVGLKHSSPSAILEHMPEHEQINSERVKSHLQKYRMNRNKSKREFMATYDSTVTTLLKDGPSKSSPTMSGPEAAAYVTFSTMQAPVDDTLDANNEGLETDPSHSSSRKNKARTTTLNQEQHDTILIPRLTEEEKKTPIGASLGYLMGLFFTLKKQLNLQREAQAAAVAATTNKPMVSSMEDPHKIGHTLIGSQPAVYDVSGTTSAADIQSSSTMLPTPSNPSMRVNIEESNMMKREMQFQMAFQNKMRLLKQQEEQKLGNKRVDSEEGLMDLMHEDDAHKMDISVDMMTDQGSGEDVQRQRGMSIGDDFWYTDCGDDQLFDFLMNN